MADDITDIKGRLVNIEAVVGLLPVDLADAHGRLDRVDARLERIERRLDPTNVALDIDQCTGTAVRSISLYSGGSTATEGASQ